MKLIYFVIFDLLCILIEYCLEFELLFKQVYCIVMIHSPVFINNWISFPRIISSISRRYCVLYECSRLKLCKPDERRSELIVWVSKSLHVELSARSFRWEAARASGFRIFSN